MAHWLPVHLHPLVYALSSLMGLLDPKDVRPIMCSVSFLLGVFLSSLFLQFLTHFCSLAFWTIGPVYTYISGDRFTSGQPRHIVSTSPRSPADHLCSDFITAYITSTRRSNGPAHIMLKTLNLQHTFVIFLDYNHIHQCSSTLFFYKRYTTKHAAKCVPDHLSNGFEWTILKRALGSFALSPVVIKYSSMDFNTKCKQGLLTWISITVWALST